MQEDLFRIVAAAQEISVAAFEDREREAVVADLAPRVLKIADETVSFLCRLMEAYEADSAEPVGGGAEGRSFLRQIDDLMADAAARERLADLAFMGRLELRQKVEALRALALGGGHAWAIIAAASSTLRSLHKALTAVEASLCEHEGLERRLGFQDETEASLAARGALAKFRFEIRRYGARSDAPERLVGATTSLAKLVGLDVYQTLRIEDRIQIRGLQQRLLAWQRGVRDPTAAHHLWEDIAAFSELLAGIRYRQELVRHDRRSSEELLGRLRQGESAAALLPGLKSLLGRDDDLDTVLFTSGQPSSGIVQALLERIASEGQGA